MRTDREIITSRKNRDIVEAAKLSDKKARDSEGLFRFDGLKLAAEAAEKGAPVLRVFMREDKLGLVEEKLAKLPDDCRVTAVTEEVFSKLSDEKSPEGVICVAKHLDNVKKNVKIDNGDSVFADGKRIFLAESVRDPGNLGTLIRSANALGCERMIISNDCADPYNPKAVRASMGAIFDIEIVTVENIGDAAKALISNGRRVFAAALDRNARKLGSFELSAGDCFAVGNEGHGLKSETVNACTQSVYIPMKAGAESLNAAAAAAVILWEQARMYL